MINLRDATLRRGAKVLFQHATVTVHAGEMVGVVGRNGSGKSSLFDAIRGEATIDAGELDVPRDVRLSSLRQEIPSSSLPTLEFVKDGDEELRRIEGAIAAASSDTNGERLARLHAELDAIGGYDADTRAAKLMVGLGFAPEDLVRSVDTLSGGWRMRLNLARSLMCRSDVLLLDEPTNHLDLEAVLWLEAWIRSYPGTLLLISHDRDFLDRVVERILHLDGESIVAYRGNYSEFERLRAESIAQAQAAAQRQTREAARIRRFVDRFRAQASKARQAQSRLKALERMGEVAAAHIDSPFSFEFPPLERLPDPMLSLRGAAIGYGERPVLEDVFFTLSPGDRLGILGENGAGKSTLMRTLGGLHAVGVGERIEHPGLRIGYFAQHELELLDPSASPLLHHRRRDPDASEQILRNFLGGFGFRGEEVEAPVERFSGGEKSRLVLSLLVRDAPNVLLLDEPTNHLDMDMRRALELALQDFPGALVLVAHDRHLLRTCTDELWLVADGRLARFDDALEAYGRSAPTPKAARAPPPLSAARREPTRDRRTERQAEAAARRRHAPLLARVRRVEKLIGDLEAQRSALDASLADPDLYAPARKPELDERLFERARTAQRLDQLEAEWLTLHESLETARSALAQGEGGEAVNR